MQFLTNGVHARQVKLLLPGSAAELHTLEERLDDVFTAARHGNGNPQVALDLLVLAQQDIQHHAVDLVVDTEVRDDAHLVTRLAEAHREIASTAGEPATMRGFPPSMINLLAGFAERAGPGTDGQGDITAVFTVLVSGSDMEEPVADTLRGLLDGHVVLSRSIAERGRFPAVDILKSVSRSLPEAASEAENQLVGAARQLLNIYEDSEIMVRSGLYQPGANQEVDTAVALFPQLDAFAAKRVEGGFSQAFDDLAACLAKDVKKAG